MQTAENQHKLNVQIYQLTKDILFEAFSIETNLFTAPFSNSSSFDHGIREMMWPGFKDQPASDKVINILDNPFVINLLKSNLGFYNMVVTLPSGQEVEVLTIGPFRAQDTTAKYFEQILIDAKVPAERLLQAESIFRDLPKANPDKVCKIVQRISCEYYREFENNEINSISFLNETHKAELADSELNKYLYTQAETYMEVLNKFGDAIITGNTKQARDLVHRNFDTLFFKNSEDLTSQKRTIYLINAFAAFRLLNTGIHPYRIIELFKQFSSKIWDCSDAMALSLMPYDICHKYTLLVKNHNHEGYSPITGKIMDYVLLNLDEDLSLEAIAARFSRNKTTLSSTFHKETGQTLTDFVSQARATEAIRLLNSTDASVSSIALSLGFTDFTSFSRTFKKYTGLSPRAYRQKLVQPK